MTIDVKSLSITSLFNTIKSFFKSQENNSKWKDLNTGSEGNFFMRMLATIVAVISHRVIVGRRECYHDTANFLSSQIALAVNNGYSVCRGYNLKRTITLTSSVDRIIPKMSVIGFYDTDHSIITMESLELQSGKSYTFEVCVGVLKEISWTANTEKPRTFVRFEQNISEDYVLFLDGTEVPTSNIKKDNLDDKYYVYTNPYKSVSIEYLNTAEDAKYTYTSSSTFTLRYIELDDVEVTSLTSDMFNIGEITNIISTSNFVDFESINDIKINSPLYRETQNLVRSQKDYPDMIKASLPSIREVGFKGLTPSYLSVTYIKDDYTLLTETEYEYLNEVLEPAMGLSRPFPDITDPQREVTTFDITLGIKDRYTEESDIQEDIQNIIDGLYKDSLKQTIDIYDIEEQIMELTYVKYARVSFHTETREPYNVQKLGDMITETTTYTDESDGTTAEESKDYICTAILGKTDSYEPSWNIPYEATDVSEMCTKLETQDGEIIWLCYKRLSSMDIQEWEADTLYAVNDFVYSSSIPNYMFKCIDIISYSNATEPDVTDIEEGDYLEDGNLLCVCVPYDSLNETRVSSTKYRLRDRYNLNGCSFEVIGHLGNTGGNETLIFNDAEYELYSIPEDARGTRFFPQAGNLYIDNSDIADSIVAGDTMRVSTVITKEQPYTEVSSDNLRMQSYINATVADYSDSSSDDDDEDDGSSEETTTTVITYTIDTGIPTGYSGSSAPDVSSLSEGDTVEDGELLAQVITYVSTLENRINSALYRVGEQVNIDDVSIEYIGVISDEETTTSTSTSSTSTSTSTTSSSSSSSDTESDSNANWKELEYYLDMQKQIHKWIESEAIDSLRTPEDVLQFYSELGETRVSAEDISKLRSYYEEFNPEDEEQIYLHMEQFGSTRLEAIEELRATSQLGNAIATSSTLRYYNTETDELVYLDNYVTSTTTNYEIQRMTVDGDLVADRLYYYDGTLLEETISTTTVESVNTFIATIKSSGCNTFNVLGAVKELTWIEPESAIDWYESGSYVNLSFTKTNDGRVRWEEFSDKTERKYAWNVYPNFEFNVTLQY